MNRQQGASMIELVGALAAGMLGLAGILAWTDAALEDGKGQQAARYQAQLTQAAQRYIDANYAALLAQAGPAMPARVTLAMLKASGHLAQQQAAVNAYGQSPCVLVRQSTPGRLDALVLSEGGSAIPARNLAYVASGAGRGGGFIPALTPAVAQGAFQSWSMPLAGFAGASCSGTAAAANHLASALFFDGPGQLSSDFLYRHAVPGQPQLNQMMTPLHLRATALEASSDSLCVAGNAATYGRIAVDASGGLLHCRLGVWRRPGGNWKEAVAAFAALPVSGNETGDVRLAGGQGRAFRWNGAAWTALQVDQSGHLLLPGRLNAGEALIGQTVLPRTACTADGQLARDAGNALLSCQLGKWRPLSESAITDSVFERSYSGSPLKPSPVIDNIDLAQLPGPRPLFITGIGYCQTANSTNSEAHVVFLDGAGKHVAKAGSCIADGLLDKGLVHVGTVIALQQIPENAATVQVLLRNADNGTAANQSALWLKILGSR
ncbi:shufflon system plasmid conjugative transfer pilus tip adhesin PilV [Massilia sp. erpn]|uniref:shufflon system plasmid conjugative transfer pilus tip adhesin PilV n=1 Tax=Massilia sp. erpn TaxID=2738142 RepID=UPI0021026018|nr:shufflon system plasmid conjugative transfer pilus tip adhesin PilV [Massilia sp. erpn]UTY59681.1 shufflon system plasmid conjugative transfer pilus tip adhesin PilV [Massilia sp. erpn]